MKAKTVAQKAREITIANRKHDSKKLVKLICDHAIVAAELKFVGIMIPMEPHLDIIDDVKTALTKHGFTVVRQGNRLLVGWTDELKQPGF
jgi:hypothetical protein